MSDTESFQDGKYLTAKAKGALAFIVIALFFLWVIGAFNQIKTPGSAFEKREYSGKYYALVYPDKNGVKNYKVPADIDRSCTDDGCAYYLNSITFPNGGSPTFTTCNPDLKSKSLCIADDEDSTEFYIQLTSEKVN